MLGLSSQIWLPIVTLALGYVFSLVTEAFRDRRQSRRERDARAAEREDARASLEQERADRRNQFQRETLLELQEVLHDLGRAFGREYHQDAMTAKAAGKWDPAPFLGERGDAWRRGCTIDRRIA